MPYDGIGQGALFVIEAKTASYRMSAADNGKMFTNRGAGGAITFTLAPTGDISAGWHCWVMTAAATEIVVESPTADTMTTFNDLTADSVSFATTSEIIGGAWMFTWDGTGWLTFVMAEETQTMTVVTA